MIYRLTVGLFLFSSFVFNSNSVAQTSQASQQKWERDTIRVSADSTVFFIREYIDTTLVKSYYCSWDSVDRKLGRYDFLRLRRYTYRVYSPINKREITTYPIPQYFLDQNHRDGGGEPAIIKRLN
jgi:hypothetical protein